MSIILIPFFCTEYSYIDDGLHLYSQLECLEFLHPPEFLQCFYLLCVPHVVVQILGLLSWHDDLRMKLL